MLTHKIQTETKWYNLAKVTKDISEIQWIKTITFQVVFPKSKNPLSTFSPSLGGVQMIQHN